MGDTALPPDLRHLDALLVTALPAQQAGIVVGDKRQQNRAGVGADLIRLSCGLENAQDLIEDIAQALENV